MIIATDELAPQDAASSEEREASVTHGVARAAIVIMLGNIFSRVLGFARVWAISHYFGAGPQVQGYVAALRVQTSIYDLLISGVISAAFIPVFSAIRDDEREFQRVGSTILTLTVLVMAVAMGALELLTRDVVALLVQNSDPVVRGTSIEALRLLAPAVVFLGASGVLTALLYAKQRFIFPAFSPAIFNLSIVLAAVALNHILGINCLVFGVLGGAAGQVVLQTIGLRHVRLRFALALSDPRVRQIGRLYLPVFLGLIITQAQVLLDLGFATSTGRGLVYLQNATSIYQLPLGIVATAMSLASLPTLSVLTGAEYRATLARGLVMTLLLIMPAIIVCGILSYPTIALLLHSGHFTLADTQGTAEALRYYTPGLGFAALDQLLIFAFYAKNDTKTPVIVGVISIFCYLIVALVTLHPLSYRGLALADSTKQIAHAGILYILLRRWQGRIEGLAVRGSLGKILCAGVATGLLCLLALNIAGSRWMVGTLHLLLLLVVVGGMSILFYALLLSWWRVPELQILTRRVRERFGGASSS